MKRMDRGRGRAPISRAAVAALLLAAGSPGRADEASEPVFDAKPAAPAEAKTPPAAPNKATRELQALRAKAAELEQALAQEAKRRQKAMDDLSSVWRQL